MRDPIEARADESEDLYDVAEWEPRTALDKLAMGIYGTGVFLLRLTVILARVGLYLLGVVILFYIMAAGYGAIIIDNPFVLGLIVLSVIPAGLLALYVYRTDVTTREPGTLLIVTYILSILFASFAAIINSTLGIIQGFGLLGLLLSYYLGLAKFNREHAVPIVIKGLLIAAFIHATYNSLVNFVPRLVVAAVPGVPFIVVFFGFVVVYVGFFLYILYRKLQRYSRKYRQVNADIEGAANIDSELTEFDAD